MFGDMGNTLITLEANLERGRKPKMPWKEVTKMSSRREFVEHAKQETANISQLCRQFGISRKTGYKWLKRYKKQGKEGLLDQSRKPRRSPKKTSEEIEAAILKVRDEHDAWGGRKIKRFLEDKGHKQLPNPSTITVILQRNEKISEEESKKHKPYQRFEMEEPNQLWQMDYKGYFPLAKSGYCHPLTVLDDHSRFLLGLRACENEQSQTVQANLTNIFRHYGMPDRMLMDNGSPWGNSAESPYTILTVWLIRLGIKISHGRAYHPQTQGKDERLHRTLNDELLKVSAFYDLSDCQRQFDDWRDMYNFERPHEALGMNTPSSRYRASLRPFPEGLPPILYDCKDAIRKVDVAGRISFKNHVFRVGKAFRHNPIAVHPTDVDGVYDIIFCDQKVSQISLHNGKC